MLISAQLSSIQKGFDLLDKAVKWDILKKIETLPVVQLLKNYVPIVGAVYSTFFIFYDMNKKTLTKK